MFIKLTRGGRPIYFNLNQIVSVYKDIKNGDSVVATASGVYSVDENLEQVISFLPH